MGRGKYRITDEALRMFEGGWQPLSEEEKEKGRREEIEQRKKIKSELGISQEKYLSEAHEEYKKLKAEQEEDDESELFSKALDIVAERYQTSDDDSS